MGGQRKDQVPRARPICLAGDDALKPNVLIELLNRAGVVLVDRVRDGAHLHAIAELLGSLTTPGVGMSANLHQNDIYKVQVRNEGRGLTDAYGNVIVSTTNDEFPLHTDAYNAAEPPRIVLLCREDDSDDTTESVIADSRAALQCISIDAVEALLRPVFPSAVGSVAVLTRVAERFDVRFNGVELDRWGLCSRPVAARRAVREFSAALLAVAWSYVIQPSQCLILDNRRVCHGRGRMDVGSARVLQRLWID